MECRVFTFFRRRILILGLQEPKKKLVELRKAVIKYVIQANKNLIGTKCQSELFFPAQNRWCKLSINRYKREFRKQFFKLRIIKAWNIPPGTRLKQKTLGSPKGAIDTFLSDKAGLKEWVPVDCGHLGYCLEILCSADTVIYIRIRWLL